MSEHTATTWTCSRCGATEVVEGTGQPRLWGRVQLATPPRHAEPLNLGDLCNDCGGLLVSFVHGTEVEDAAKAAEIKRLTAAAEGQA